MKGNGEKKSFDLLMNSMPGGVARMRYDNGLIIEYANDTLYRLMHTDKEDMANIYHNHYESVIYPQDWELMQEKIRRSVQTGELLQMEYQLDEGGKSEVWRMMQAVVLEKGEKPVLQCVVTDISEAKTAYLQLEQQQKKLDIIAQLSGDMLFEYDVQKDSIQYTKLDDNVINLERNIEHYVKNIQKYELVHPDDEKVLQDFCNDLTGGKQKIHVEMRKLYKDGQYHWVDLEGITIYNKKGNAEKIIGKSQNIDERKAREKEFREKSEKDSLTGLLNHRVTRERISKKIRNMQAGTDGYLMVADIDNFKQVNDTNGHLFGDTVICTFADKLKELFPDAIKGRVGGDEFMMLTEGMSEEEMEDRLLRLQEEFQSVYQEDNSGLKISCSCGLILCDKRGMDSKELFEWADYALYQVKRNQKGKFLIYNPKEGQVPELNENKQTVTDKALDRQDTLIHDAEALVLFSLELLENVVDIHNGLKMVSDRICQFFDFDDIVCIREIEGVRKKVYHWRSRKRPQPQQSSLCYPAEDWEYIDNGYDEQGIEILRHADMEKMQGETVGSILFVRAKEQNFSKGCIAFVDRKKDRDWSGEKDVLFRLANIIFGRLQQLYENEQEKQAVEQRLNYDSLTKLYQYFKFTDLAKRYMEENPERTYYFVYSDFSNFQYLNELYGYAAGDSVLKEFAQELKEKCTDGIYFTRVASDQFISMLSGDDIEKVKGNFLKLTSDFCRRLNSKYDHCNISMVSGLCQVQPDHGTLTNVLDYANIARKYGKSGIETSLTVYDAEMKSRSSVEKSIVANMVTAMENDEFQAYIQPKVSLRTGKIIGGEALARWIKSDGTVVYPDQFVPVFEKNGFITRVDFRVLEQVLQYMEEAIGVGEEVVPISVNFSRRHNESKDFTKYVVQRLKQHHIPGRMLEAEVTESVFMMDLSMLKENINRLHDYGVQIAIDDFGSGYSSLNVLANIPADVIKLDKKFFDFICETKRNKDFIRSLIGMVKHMGMTTVMEGVETREQLEFMKESGCDVVQGYYYAKPMPLHEFRRFMAEFNSAGKG